jgi:hypothetical protein
MKIVTLSAKAQHGKDLTASILKEKLEHQNKKVLIVHYADYLKFICREYFGWDGQKNEKGRTILQQIGTEKIRTRDPDFHVGILTRMMKVFAKDYDYFLIPDTRFPNEIEYLKNNKFNIITLNVLRLNFENNLTPEQRQHKSEIALDGYNFDYYLKSESGIEALEKEVDKFIKFLNGGCNEEN